LIEARRRIDPEPHQLPANSLRINIVKKKVSFCNMLKIAESKVLLKVKSAWPEGFKVAGEEFRAGWTVMRTGGAQRLQKKIQTHGWHLVRLVEGALRSGVGSSAQLAVGNALALALRHVDAASSAVEVESIEVTRYPWFFLARVSVRPFRAQRHAAPTSRQAAGFADVPETNRRTGSLSAELYPQLAGAMPLLKGMLTASAARTP
jgi:hypothetical protein